MSSDSVRSDIGPFAIMPRWLFLDPRLDGKALRVLGYLASYADRDGTNCRPLQKRMAEELGISVDTLQRAIDRLEEFELVDVTPRLVSGRKVGNDYFVRHLSTVAAGCRKPAASAKTAELASTETATGAVSYDQTSNQTIFAAEPEIETPPPVENPTDEIEICKRVIDRIVDQRVAGRSPHNVHEYRKKVRTELEREVGDRLRRVVRSHPGAPTEMYAAYAVGEPTPYLSNYRPPA